MSTKNSNQLTFWNITLRTIVIHTITYFVVGLLAYSLFNYSERFAEPPMNAFMRPTSDPIVAAGVLFQPLRGLLFGIVFYLLRNTLFTSKNGWLITWVMLVFVGIFSTFGPAPGSVEGFVYTIIPLKGQFGGLAEVLTQSLLLSILVFYWVRNPRIRWLNWGLSVLFFIVILLPILGMLASQAMPR